MKIKINHKSVDKYVDVVKSANTLWLHIDGKTYSYSEELKKRSSKRSSASANDNELRAPMPGKIIKVNKIPNNKVLAGESVVVMEAMKMEYNIKSPVDTEVSELLCKVGDQVVLGQLLVKMKTKDSE